MGKRSREKRERREMMNREVNQKKEKPSKERGLVGILLKVIQWSVYLILFTPILVGKGFYFPYVGLKSIYFMGLTEIIFFSWVFLIFISPKYRPQKNPLLIVLILFVVVLILSSLLGVDLFYSFWSKYERMTGLLMWFHLLAFFLVISSVFKKMKDWFRILSCSVFVAILISFISFLGKAGHGISPSSWGGATLGNSSFLATYLLFNVFLALYLSLEARGPLRVFNIVGLVIVGLGLLLSTGRAAIISFWGGMIMLFLLWGIFKKKGIIKLFSLSLLCLILTFGIFGIYVAVFFDHHIPQMVFRKLDLGTMGGRTVVWEEARQGFLERPWLGWGPENFEFAFSKYYNPCLGSGDCGTDVWYDRSHNIIFDTLVTTGVFGLISYLGIFFSVFYILWKRFYQKRFGFWTAGIFSVTLISYFVQNLTVFDMINSYMMWFLVLGFVAFVSLYKIESLSGEKEVFFEKRKNETERRTLPHPLIFAFILVLFIFSFTKFVIQPLRADYYVIKAIRAKEASEQRVDLYKKTLSTSSLGKHQVRDFFSQLALDFYLSGRAENLPRENIKKDLDFIIQELEKSIKEVPIDYRSYLDLGRMYNIYTIFIDSSKIPRAEEVLNKALELSPTNQQGYWELAQTKLFENKEKEALFLVKKARDLNPQYKRANMVVVQTAKFTEDVDIIKEEVKTVLKINPSWEEDIKKILGERDGMDG